MNALRSLRCLVFALLLVPRAAGSSEEGRVAALVRANPPSDARGAERLAISLAATGATALPELFAELQRVLPQESADEQEPPEPSAVPAAGGASSWLAQALIGAIEHIGADERDHWLARREQAGLALAERRTVLFVFEHIGRAADVEHCLHWGERATLAAAREHALSAILRRDPRAFAPLHAAIQNASEELLESFVRVLATSERPEGLRGLLDVAQQRPTFKLLAFGTIAACAAHYPRPVAPDALAAVRRMVEDPRSEVLPEAILAAGKLDDDEAAPILIERLSDRRAGIRADALWALERLSGLHLHERPTSWSAWYAADREWWNTRAEACFLALREGDPGARTQALTEIGRAHLGRHRIAREIARALPWLGDGAACIACRVLARLRSPLAFEALIDELSAQDPARRQTAHEALVATSGKQLPLEPRAWKEWLEPPVQH